MVVTPFKEAVDIIKEEGGEALLFRLIFQLE